MMGAKRFVRAALAAIVVMAGGPAVVALARGPAESVQPAHSPGIGAALTARETAMVLDLIEREVHAQSLRVLFDQRRTICSGGSRGRRRRDSGRASGW